MKETGLVTCQCCGARFDRDYGKCWKCGTRTNSEKDGSRKEAVSLDEVGQMHPIVQNVLVLALAFVLMGACSIAPGLLIVVSIGFVIYYAIVATQNRSQKKKAGGTGDVGVAISQSTAKSDPYLNILFKALATMVLLPLCVVIGLFILCGGFFTIISLNTPNEPYVSSFLVVIVSTTLVAILLFYVLSKALIKVFKS